MPFKILLPDANWITSPSHWKLAGACVIALLIMFENGNGVRLLMMVTYITFWKTGEFLNFWFDVSVNLMCNHGEIYKWFVWKEICEYLERKKWSPGGSTSSPRTKSCWVRPTSFNLFLFVFDRLVRLANWNYSIDVVYLDFSNIFCGLSNLASKKENVVYS